MAYSRKHIVLLFLGLIVCTSIFGIFSVSAVKAQMDFGIITNEGPVFLPGGGGAGDIQEERDELIQAIEESGPPVESGGWFYNQLVEFLGFIISVVIYLFGFITGIAVVLLDAATSISKFSTNPVVERGWQFTRDALNFMFILAILIIAFAEIAGISGWNIRALLPRLLVAALLVNFSLAIGGAFIDFSRVLMDAVSGGDSTELSRQLMGATVIERFYKFNPDNYFSLTRQSDSDQASLEVGADTATNRLVSHIIAAIMIFFITITLLIAALFMLVRAIALWVLLILSPVGFVFTILPQTKAWADKWWESFIKYVMYGPVFVFFLALAGQVGKVINDDGLKKLLYLDNTGPSAGGKLMDLFLSAEPGLGSTIFQSMLVSIFIIFGILSAQALGVYGGGKAAGMMTGLAGLGLKGVREGTGAGYVGRRVKAGWEAASAERKREAELKQRTSIPGQIGAFARAPFSGETRERAMQRSVAERTKQMDESGMDGESAIAGMNAPGKTMVEKRASAALAVKRDALDEPKDYQTALELLKGTKEHANVQRNYRRAHPMLERTGSKDLTEAKVKLATMKTSDPTKHASVVKEIQDDVRKAKSDQARDWSGDTIQVMVDNKIHPGSSNVRTIMREGSPEARTALQTNKGELEKHEQDMYTSEGGA